MRANLQRALLATAVMLGPISASAQGLPTREGVCVRTRITQLEHRLQSGDKGPFVPDSGIGSALRKWWLPSLLRGTRNGQTFA